jgi:hypothetical protein
MNSRFAAIFSAIALASSSMSASVVHAQQSDPLAEADAAYVQIDFELVRVKARQAIERGGYSRVQLARAYFLLGIALAALGEDANDRVAAGQPRRARAVSAAARAAARGAGALDRSRAIDGRAGRARRDATQPRHHDQ